MGAMGDDPNPDSLAADEARLAAYAAVLADAVEGALPGFVERSVRSRLTDEQADRPEVASVIEDAGRRARDELAPRVRALLAQDIDGQRTNPLAILRTAVRYPTEVLDSLGIAPGHRDADAVRLFPDDVYDLTPGSFAEIDPSLHEPGLHWGAAKAFVHRARHGRGAQGSR